MKSPASVPKYLPRLRQYHSIYWDCASTKVFTSTASVTSPSSILTPPILLLYAIPTAQKLLLAEAETCNKRIVDTVDQVDQVNQVDQVEHWDYVNYVDNEDNWDNVDHVDSMENVDNFGAGGQFGKCGQQNRIITNVVITSPAHLVPCRLESTRS